MTELQRVSKMLETNRLSSVLSLRSHLKSATLCTLRQILSHCVEEHYETPKLSNSKMPQPASLNISEIDRLDNENFRSTPRNPHVGGISGNETERLLQQTDGAAIEVESLSAIEYETVSILPQVDALPLPDYCHMMQEKESKNYVTFGNLGENNQMEEQQAPEGSLRAVCNTVNSFLEGVGGDGNVAPGTEEFKVSSDGSDSKFRLNLPVDEEKRPDDVERHMDEKRNEKDERVLRPNMHASCIIDESSLTNEARDGVTMDSPISLIVNTEMEDGEISDDGGSYCRLVDLLLEDISVYDGKTTEEEAHDHSTKEDYLQFHSSSQSGVGVPESIHSGISCSHKSCSEGKSKMLPGEFSDGTGQALGTNSKMPELQNSQSAEGKFQGHVTSNKSAESSGSVPELIVDQAKTSSVTGAKVREKKKGTSISAERKLKKKLAKKRKRAEKNKKEGVKRLKLEPFSKPRVVKHCRYYLHGRCQQGDKCNFSHDVIPLTKSQPCKHFARNSCLKGDDCPFDHELSKYPCHNYMSKGTCNRGDSCHFSHKIAVTSGSSQSPAKKSECLLALAKANLPTQLNMCGTSKSAIYSIFNDVESNVTDNLGTCASGRYKQGPTERQPTLPCLHSPPDGITFLSYEKSSVGSCTKKQSEDYSHALFKEKTVVAQGNPLPCPSVKSSACDLQCIAPSTENTNLGSKGSDFSSLVSPSSYGMPKNESVDASQILEEFLFGGNL